MIGAVSRAPARRPAPLSGCSADRAATLHHRQALRQANRSRDRPRQDTLSQGGREVIWPNTATPVVPHERPIGAASSGAQARHIGGIRGGIRTVLLPGRAGTTARKHRPFSVAMTDSPPLASRVDESPKAILIDPDLLWRP